MGVKIITDSGSDITQDTAKKWGIVVLPLTVRFGEEEFLDDYTLTADGLYTRMIETGEIPKTSQVPPFAYELAFAQAVAEGDTVVCITLSSGMSDCWQSACIAARKFGDKVSVVDSLNVCASQYALVRYAEGMVRMGKSHDEIVHRLERDKKRLHVISLVDTLEYVHRGGRLSLVKTVAGGVLRIKPIITADEEGKVRVLAKARGKKNAYQMFTEFVEEAGGIDFSLPVCMAYSGLSDENMREYMMREAALFEGNENSVHKMQFGATVGTYSGPGAFAIGFFHRRIATFS
ncbi:MAG: DegV family protein [Eubacteriales bacterium]|nr:DegV family protein [Eubacteriales bacterium]